MNYTVIIPAAGEGKRMKAGKNKQLLELDGTPLIIHTLIVFERDKWCVGIILVVNQQEESEMLALIERFGIKKIEQIVTGGAERQDSVYRGLNVCEGQEIVLIHDGARPFITSEMIHHLVKEAAKSGAVIPALPVTDTIKKATNGLVVQTLERSSLWAVQTPQAFRLFTIKEAYEKAQRSRFYGTDDAALIEQYGGRVAVVEGDHDNMKITTPADLEAAHFILRKRGDGHAHRSRI